MLAAIRTVLCACLALSLAAPAARAETGDAETRGELIALIRDALAPESGAIGLETIRALRDLRDAELRPLFADVAAREDSLVRDEAVLALAEVGPEGAFPTETLARIEPAAMRARILGRALAEELLGVDDLRAALRWPDLEPALELLLRSRLARLGEDPNIDRVRALAAESGGASDAARVFAMLLVAAGSGESDAPDAWALLDSLPEDVRPAALGVALAQIVDEELTGLSGFTARAVAENPPDSLVGLQAARTQLLTDPDAGVRTWDAIYALAQSPADRIRVGMLLLGAVETAPPEAFDALVNAGETPLVEMGLAGRAAAARDGDAMVGAMLELARLRQDPTVDWIFFALESMTPEQRVAVCDAMIQDGLSRQTPSAAPRFAFEAAVALARDDAARLRGPILAAAGAYDGPMMEALLVATLRGRALPPWDVADPPRWPSATTQELALIITARAGAELDDTAVEDLARTALSGAGLPAGFRAQSAWLALKRRGEQRRALADLLAP